MPQSGDDLNVCSHLEACSSLQGEVLEHSVPPQLWWDKMLKQHPVCAFVSPPSTLRYINKYTAGQACSLLKQGSHFFRALHTVFKKKFEDVCNNA